MFGLGGSRRQKIRLCHIIQIYKNLEEKKTNYYIKQNKTHKTFLGAIRIGRIFTFLKMSV